VAISCDTGVGPVATSSAGSNSGSGTSGEESNQVDEKIYYTVTFMNAGTVYHVQSVEEGKTITLPANPFYNDCEFMTWEAYIQVDVPEENRFDWPELITVDSNTVVSQNMTVRAKYRYHTYYVVEGTFVAVDSRAEYLRDDHRLYSKTYENSISLTGDLKNLMMALSEVMVPPNGRENHYEIYNYYGIDINRKLDEVRLKPGVEFELSDDGSIVIFNYEGPEQTGTALRDWDKPLAGYTWIFVFLGDNRWMTGYIGD
jgi:hypothetical protein